MFNYRTLAIIKRELREKLMSKAFIIMTILLPVFMFGIIGVQTLLFTYKGDSGTRVEILTEEDELLFKIESELSERDFVKSGNYIIIYNSIDSGSVENYINEKKENLIEEKLDGIIFIPTSAKEDKGVRYYSKTPSNRTIPEKLDGPINKVLVEEYFKDKNISENELSYARMGIDIKGFKVTKDEKIEEEGFGNLILSYLFTFLLYISLLMMGQMTMQSVQEEKNSRIVEVLLSSVSSKELMAGKVLGSAITGSFQMAIWLLPVLVVISTTWFVLPSEVTFDITLFHIIYFLFNFFLGLIIFLGLFATVGSIFENTQEAQSGMWPIMLLIMIPFFISLSMMRNPTNPIAEISSLLPFATIIVMPGRITIVEVPVWQLIFSVALNIITIYTIFMLAGKIYRVGILRTGKKPTWGEVFRWLKYKY
ncbi:ABC transporter permease [Bacteroidota bacterium]